MDPSRFRVLDVSRFPAVMVHGLKNYPGYAPQWQAELEHLIANAAPFYMLFMPGPFNEDPADLRLRSLWLKANKARLGAICKSMVSIEADAAKRQEIEAYNVVLVKGFGIARLVAADIEQAHALGRRSVGIAD